MMAYGLPILYTLLVWWASTGLILYLDGLHPRTFVWSMAGASAVLALAVWGFYVSSGDTSTAGAYIAFTSALGIWGWHLCSFYMGYVTGPRTTSCDADMRGWPRFVQAVRTSLYHEIAVLGTAAAMLWLTWGQPNQTGVWTFVALWWMHQSAKLNIYFGVPNLGDELLPDHLRYLRSYMTRKPMNLLFPISVSASTVLTVLLVQKALAADATAYDAASLAMLATLMTLAIAEHWFLVLPLHATALWQFAVKPLADENDAGADAPVALTAPSAAAVPPPGPLPSTVIASTVQDDSDYARPTGRQTSTPTAAAQVTRRMRAGAIL